MHAVCHINFSSTSVHLAKSHFRLSKLEYVYLRFGFRFYFRLLVVIWIVDQSTTRIFDFVCLIRMRFSLPPSLLCFLSARASAMTNGPFYIKNEPCCFHTHNSPLIWGDNASQKTHVTKDECTACTFNTCINCMQSSCGRVCCVMGYFGYAS